MTQPSLVATMLVAATILATRADARGASIAQPETLQVGTFVEKVASAKDPTQTYTLYLPKAYTPQRRWPLLFVFDPRGRGTMAAEIFKEAAERFGWIIASSDNTRSDGPWEPNRRAILAMWPDVLTRYAVDEKRIYAAGFSGGAGVATVVATTTGHVAGIIAAGAPDPGESEKTPSVAWFGAAGRVDFNFLDAKSTDDRMRRASNPRRLEYFEGGHQWLPRAMAVRAAGWLEALAMKDGRRARDAQLAGELRDADVAAARALEDAGRLTEASRVYSSVIETFGELTDVRDQRSALSALERAVENGFTDRARLEGDERFASIRQTAEFSRVLERMSLRLLHHPTTRSFAIEQINMNRLKIANASSDWPNDRFLCNGSEMRP
jgi:dienelactone hydrolase